MSPRCAETISISPATLQAFSDKKGDAAQLLVKDIEAASGKIVALLRELESFKEDAARVFTFSVKDISLFNETGFVEIQFSRQVCYGCRELTEWVADHVRLAVRIDIRSGKAVISSEDVPA